MENRDLVWGLMRVQRLQRRAVESSVCALGIHPSQHHFLMFLAGNPNATQAVIASTLRISPATVAVSIKKLEAGGYIKRKTDKSDSRKNRIELTQKGLETVKKTEKLFKQKDDCMFNGFSEEDKEKLAEYINRIRTNFGDTTDDDLPPFTCVLDSNEEKDKNSEDEKK
ncbi:MAG: MarR family winged helix-turn-helix transcriptional regulator [Lachnospiraceae bacterium]|nr:MarR family winged helix-turn-helix transcriptional regulator [Lachnospiraceae bacterium]